jgi:hypothetical protein
MKLTHNTKTLLPEYEEKLASLTPDCKSDPVFHFLPKDQKNGAPKNSAAAAALPGFR